MTLARVTAPILRLDAIANGAIAVALLIAARPLADAANFSSTWPLLVVAALLAANGVACWAAARSAAPALVRELGIVDVVFTAAVMAFAVLDPTAAGGWLRAALATLAGAVGIVGAIKLVGANRLPDIARRDAAA